MKLLELIFTVTFGLFLGAPAFAIPMLQLDILNGNYVEGTSGIYTDDTVATSQSFTLYALLSAPTAPIAPIAPIAPTAPSLPPKLKRKNFNSQNEYEAYQEEYEEYNDALSEYKADLVTYNLDLTDYNKDLADYNEYLNTEYYISAALTPKVKPDEDGNGQDLGSFSFAEVTYNATKDMTYGTPPLEILDPEHESGDLSKHSIFNTYFLEIPFKFSELNLANSYNVEDAAPHLGPQDNDVDGDMYYMSFLVDTSNLNSKYAIHFDLYSIETISRETCTRKKEKEVCTTTTDIVVADRAPYSHDATSLYGGRITPPGGGDENPVPAPATLLLIGAGLLGMRRRLLFA